MKTRALSFSICLFLMISCDFRKSVHIDFLTGMVTKGNGLSCEDVSLTIGEEIVQRNSFTYGEKFTLNFNNIEGFERIDDHVFPGMKLIVISEGEDTVLLNQDLYSNRTEGIDLSPLLLKTTLTVADPIRSNGAYTLVVDIWDKKSDGFFTAKLDFTVIPNDKIDIESNRITYKEIYIYSKQRSSVITKNIAYFNENIYIMFEGLEGFIKEGENVSVGLRMLIRDSERKLIVNEQDLLIGSGFNYSELHSQVFADFILTGSQINNPVDCEITIWDKRGEGSIKASTQLQIEN